jgi:pyruvate kinase
MTKILTTVGPISCNDNVKFCLKKSEILRFNMSHNSLDWHKKNISYVKKKNPLKYVLVDIPGAKPRTLNTKAIIIKKGQKVTFGFKTNKKNAILISNPLPLSFKKKTNTFTISDGVYSFKAISLSKNLLTGVSLQTFLLQPKKGLNIPYSVYDDKFQENIYKKFIKKIENFKHDCIGLSFVQSSKIIKSLKKLYPDKIFISKIENYMGYLNRKEIISESDAIMIDRGDLAAEVGNEKLTEYSENIINDCKFFGKPIIIATENFNSLIENLSPSKSDILNLDYYISKKVDYIMLSDETATSKNWKNTLTWLYKYLISKKRSIKKIQPLIFESLLNHLKDQVVVVFSKKGFILDKLNAQNIAKLVLFTEDKHLAKIYNLKDNAYSFYLKFPKISIDRFLYKNIHKNKNLIFNNNENAFLINVTFPRKKSRANTFTVLSKKDF